MQQVRLGVVSFLNTTPLIEGLELTDGITLVPRVPSSLVGCLERGVVDFSLASSVDYQRSSQDLRILQVGLLSSDGQTSTVRLCSRKPIEQVTTVHCDTDSHTSVALLSIMMKDLFETDVSIIPTEINKLSDDPALWPESILMIGDKVVRTQPTSLLYEYELDLGEVWKMHTGLPFVFAMWMGNATLDMETVRFAAMTLDRQKRRNMQRLEQLVSTHATDRGWDSTAALAYVDGTMQYSWSKNHEDSLQLFFERAYELGIIREIRPIEFFDW